MINFDALFKISYGLYVVSTGDNDSGNGFISNSVFQVTSEPAKFAACCNKDNYTAELIKKYKAFAISVLHQDASSDTIGKFGYKSGKNINKLESVKKITGQTGVPIILDDAIAYIECKLTDIFDVGTHFLFIGEVVQAEMTESTKEPLTYAYYRNTKKGLAPKNAPTYVDKSKIKKTETAPTSKKYKCPACGYIYDPEKGDPDNGIPAGTKFEDLPDDWTCPLCGTEKDDFMKI